VPQQFKPGDQVERYRVESVLGEGGSARVYRVRHTTLGTVHALKLLTVDHPVLRKRLLAEGRAQARLSHPNLVPVRDVLEVDDTPALLMDFVPGQSLQQLVSAGGIDPAAAVELFTQIAAGVAYAHTEGLVHRDLKPANVLLDDTTDPPVPRVADFGLVRMLDLPEETTRHTRAGTAMGTLGYMAPEQVRDARAADARTDVFALGALLYAMLVGRAPFGGSDQLEVMNDTAQGNYLPVEAAAGVSLPPEVVAIIERALQVRPEDRYPSVDALLAELGASDAPEGDPSLSSVAGDSPMPGVSAPSSPAPATQTDLHTPAKADSSSAPASLSGISATVSGLVVDLSGRGHRVEIGVVLDPDGEGVRHAPDVARDAQVAAQLAVAVALGEQVGNYGVSWFIRGSTDAVHGTSLGLPLAVAVRCALRGTSLPEGWAFTGGLDLDGRVAPVSGVPAKVRAARSAGILKLAVPADGLGQLDAESGLEVVPVRSFGRLMDRLCPEGPVEVQRPRHPWRLRILTLVIPVMMAITGLSSALEPLLHDPLLRWIHGPLSADNTAIVAFSPQRDARALRARHPAVIDKLVSLGARTIFFDITMIAATAHDGEIARAIRDARAQGVAVVLPVGFEAGNVMFPESEEIRESAWFGVVLAQADTALWHVRRAPIRIRTLADGDHWHAAVQAVRGHLSTDLEPRVSDGELIVGPNRNPVWADLVYMHPTDPSPVYDYDAPEDWTELRGRTVLIGEMGGVADLHRTDSDTVYGIEIEAALVETILQQRAPRIVSAELDALFALLVGVLTALLGLSLPRERRLVVLVVPAAAVGVAVALVLAGVLISVVPMLLAVGLGLWSSRTPVVTTEESNP